MDIPRILLAAGASGSGKTLITCGLLQALVNRKMKVASFKCGPDYIDPMFHSRVIGTKSRNLDTFFTDAETTRYLLGKNVADCDIAVMEGVMGYYDGVGGISTKASAYDLADTTDTPVILVVNSRGMSISLAAYIKGFMEYKEKSHIKGVIFNQMSPMLYPRMKKLVEEQLEVEVLGYVPKVEDCVIESRHLGLVLPEEISDLRERLQKLAGILEDTLEIDRILGLAKNAEELQVPESLIQKDRTYGYCLPQKLRIGVAKDEAFCFFYEDNFRLLQEMGAELVDFSPIHDEHLPADLDGILLYGGYPELNGEALERNASMKEEIAQAVKQGMPCMAECGGFMYLHEEMEDADGNVWKLVGRIHGKTFPTGKLVRFGYVNLQRNLDEDQVSELKERMSIADSWILPGENIRAHEFHYWDSTDSGSDCLAVKPDGKRNWECIHLEENLVAGYPHLYYPSCKEFAERFVEKCRSGYRE